MKTFAKYLKVFNIYGNISYITPVKMRAADDIEAHNTYIQKMDLGGHNLQSAVAIKTAKGLQNISYLTTLIFMFPIIISVKKQQIASQLLYFIINYKSWS